MNALLLLLFSLGSDAYVDFFERGNAAYAAGSMAEAAAAYEQLAASGVMNPEVYFNLGNVYYHEGELGRAVLNYERALGLGFAPAERNLARAVGATANRMERPRGFALDTWRASWLPGLPAPLLAGGLVALWWVLWGILTARQGRTPVRGKFAAAPWILLVLCAVAMLLRPPEIRSAVVLAPEIPLRYGPDERDAVRATLAAGDRVSVDAERTAWVRVETAAGARGWTDRGSVAYLGPPFARELTEKEPPSP